MKSNFHWSTSNNGGNPFLLNARIFIITRTSLNDWLFNSLAFKIKKLHLRPRVKVLQREDASVFIHSVYKWYKVTICSRGSRNFFQGGRDCPNLSILVTCIWGLIPGCLTYNCGSAQMWKITYFFISSNIGAITLCK